MPKKSAAGRSIVSVSGRNEEDRTMRTPWGKAQSIYPKAEGIVRVITAGHGGYKLDRKRNAAVHEAWRKAGGWYEEDCEWAIVVLTFPQYFTEADIADAKFTAKNWFPEEYTKVTGEAVPTEESLTLRERAAREVHKGKWQTVSAYGSWHKDVPEGKVGVCAKIDGRYGQGESKYFLVPAEEYEAFKGPIGFIVDPERHPEVAKLL